jgi:hypothetical protein
MSTEYLINNIYELDSFVLAVTSSPEDFVSGGHDRDYVIM